MKRILFIISMSYALNSLAADPLQEIQELRKKLDGVEELKKRSQKLSTEVEQLGSELQTAAAFVEVLPLDPTLLILLKKKGDDQVEAVRQIREDGVMLGVIGQKPKNPV